MENLARLKILLDTTDNTEDALLSLLLEMAEKKVLDKRYPFGYTDEQKSAILERYSSVILDIAVYLYSKRGAEGQTSHSENGVNRGYESAGIPDSYVADIVPMAKLNK